MIRIATPHVVLLALACLSSPSVSQAQLLAQKVFRLGFLMAASRTADSTRIDAFRKNLQERGYIEVDEAIYETLLTLRKEAARV